MSLSVPVSWGEVIDKITILEIKTARLTSESALSNVRRELAALSKIAGSVEADPEVAALKTALKRINETLWQIEDDIRAKEAHKSFDVEFIELARAVYHNNDERGRIKRDINNLLKSDFSEEKHYAAY